MKRKGLIAVVLATAAALCGGLAPQYYTGNISYTVNPLVDNTVTLDIGDRSGATEIKPCTGTETGVLKKLPKAVDLKFQIFEGKDLDGDEVNDLAEVFRDWYHFKVTFEVLDANGRSAGKAHIEFTDANGDGAIDSDEVLSNPAVIPLDPNTIGELPANIKWTVEGRTSAPTDTVSESVPVGIYAVEK